MAHITHIQGIEVRDARGNPAVAATVVLDSGASGFAAAAWGASSGRRAVAHVNGELRQALVGRDAADQAAIDGLMIELDGTSNKSRLGAHAIFAVSLAVAKAVAVDAGLPLYRHLARAGQGKFELPVPMMNIVSGGAHAGHQVGTREFMILPVGAPSFREALRYGAEVFHALKAVLQSKGLGTELGEDGGYAPHLPSNEAALDTLLLAIETAGFSAGKDIGLGLDAASSELHKDGQYVLASEGKRFSSDEFVGYLANLVDRYPILSIEDGLAEDDWDGWRLLTERLGDKVQLVGDDVFVTNTAIFRRGILGGIANSILIRPNRIGTLSETLAAIALATDAGYSAVVLHRAGEPEDAMIADLAVATGATHVKTGFMRRSDVAARHHRLLLIEQELGADAVYGGRSACAALNP